MLHAHLKPFNAACIQMCSGRNIERNRDDLIILVREGVSMGAQFVQTPEMTNILERDRAKLFESVVSGDEDLVLVAMQEQAREAHIFIHLGSLAVKCGEKLVNRSFVIDPDGQIIARYDKIHLFDAVLPNGESWCESATYHAGDTPVTLDLPWGKLGLSICYDVRFPALYQNLAQQGAVFMSAPAAFTRPTGELHWEILQRARAIETTSFMISACQAGSHEDGRQTYGHSMIVDPLGHVIAEAKGDFETQKPCVIMAQIDPQRVIQVREKMPVLKHTRSFAPMSDLSWAD